jgi:hypothetical protein
MSLHQIALIVARDPQRGHTAGFECINVPGEPRLASRHRANEALPQTDEMNFRRA